LPPELAAAPDHAAAELGSTATMRSQQSILYVEIVNGAVYVQDQQQVAGYTRIVDRLRAAALSPARTNEAIRSRLSALT